MQIKGVNIFLGNRFVFGDIMLGERVEEIVLKSGKSDVYVIPGLVDIHTHGGGGDDFSDGSEEGLCRLDRYYLTRGTTSYLATTMTISKPELFRAMNALRSEHTGLRGIHLEGPFVSYNKRGAQAGENILLPNTELFCELNRASGNKIRLVTVAPETEGADEFIGQVSKICTVSIGHTEADFDAASRAFEYGARHVTHLYNAMPPMLHRSPGVIGAALSEGASVELICDGMHVHPSVIKAAFRMFGWKVNLISDSLRCAGMPDGEYTLGGQEIFVKGGKATLKDGTLAGSSISLLDGVKRAVSFGIPLARAVYAASTAPAKAVGLDVGSLKVGSRADAVILDSSLTIKEVIVNGKKVE